MAEPNERPDLDPVIDELLRRSGATWPSTDQGLDRWLAEQVQSPDDRRWVEDAVRRRIEEARGQTAARPAAAPAPAAAAPVADKAARSLRRLSADDLALLDRQLVELVESRVPLPEGLAAYAIDLEGGRLGRVLEDLRHDLASGMPLSQAIERRGDALPPIYKGLVAAGESAGDLTEVLALLAEQAETDAEIGRRLRESLAYPAVSLVAVVLVAWGVMPLVLAQFGQIFESMNVELPALTAWVLAVSTFVRDHLIVSVLIVAGLAAGAVRGLRLVLRRFPVLSAAPARHLAEVSRALAGFLGRGVSAPVAFRALEAAYGGVIPGGALGRVAMRLEGGATLGASLRGESAFPPTFTWLVGTAEGRGTLPETLRDLAASQERRFEGRLKLVLSAIPPVALLVLSLFVATGVVAVFLPIFKLQQSLGQ